MNKDIKIEPIYENLPFSWANKSQETIASDCRWLESIIRNSAPFSDAWVKARIIQLAYPNPPGEIPSADNIPTYAGLTSEAEIVNAIRSICDLKQYPNLAATIDQNYVICTLNNWKAKLFSPTVSRNFEIYADRLHPNVFLITSTAPVSLNVNRRLPSLLRYRPLFNIEELAKIIVEQETISDENQPLRLTLRTHGYATPSERFYKSFMAEADVLNTATTPHPEKSENPELTCLNDNHFYIGYHWPSEMPVISQGLWIDVKYNWNILVKFLLVLGIITSIFGVILYGFLKLLFIPLLKALAGIPAIADLGNLLQFSGAVATAVTWYWMIPTVFILWTILIQLLRLFAYQRDRYRAIHYGAPDLAEFFWRLDKAITKHTQNLTKKHLNSDLELTTKKPIIAVNLIGHSMGALLLVNALRNLSDRFGKDDGGSLVPDYHKVNTEQGEQLVPNIEAETAEQIGDHFVLDKLILASPDIPLEFLREGRNNYVRSAMRRCRQIYLFSSDRDITLRYLAMLGNWFSEPSLEMSGYRLGNVFLQPILKKNPGSGYRLVIRNLIGLNLAVEARSAYDLFQKFNYIDCSQMQGLNGSSLPLSGFTALFIDLTNAVGFAFNIDSHGGYFFTASPSFAVIKLLLTLAESDQPNIDLHIQQLIQKTPLKFLPSQPLNNVKL